jgi:hypothetical protein
MGCGEGLSVGAAWNGIVGVTGSFPLIGAQAQVPRMNIRQKAFKEFVTVIENMAQVENIQPIHYSSA